MGVAQHERQWQLRLSLLLICPRCRFVWWCVHLGYIWISETPDDPRSGVHFEVEESVYH